MDIDFIGLDIETAPEGDADSVFALQPWRVLEGKAKITALAVARAFGGAKLATSVTEMQSFLDELAGKYVVTWNGIFDVSWLFASRLKGGKVKWMDAMLLWKAVDNSQLKEMQPSWSLAAGVERWCMDEPWAEAFIAMKKEEHEAGEDDKYWIDRCKLDAFATARIATKAWASLTDKQRRLECISAACIDPVARSWVRGVRLDVAVAAAKSPVIIEEMFQIEQTLGVVSHPKLTQKKDKERAVKLKDEVQWVPSKILSSPKQLGELLFGKQLHPYTADFDTTGSWCLKAKNFSEKTGLPSSDKKALTYLADYDDRIISILRWRELNTQYTKFIKGIAGCSQYLNSTTAHPQPSLGATYTRRMTYRSKSGSKGAASKANIGIALHQFPRPKELRKLILPPKGKVLGELDASGQESRLMCIFSGDENMTHIFRSGGDIHSYTGAEIAGMSYESFMAGKALKNETIVGPHGLRYQGKFTNLSNNYRIGVKNLRIKARVDYGMDVDWDTAMQWQRAFFRAYPRIKEYWSEAIFLGKQRGYAETLAGRRFRLDFWDDPDRRWDTESSAIMQPIQGSGADQKELANAVVAARFPHVEFGFDLHDAMFLYLDENDDYKSTMLEIRHTLNNLPYKEAWGWEPPIPLPWDASVGESWGAMEELK